MKYDITLPIKVKEALQLIHHKSATELLGRRPSKEDNIKIDITSYLGSNLPISTEFWSDLYIDGQIIQKLIVNYDSNWKIKELTLL